MNILSRQSAEWKYWETRLAATVIFLTVQYQDRSFWSDSASQWNAQLILWSKKGCSFICWTTGEENSLFDYFKLLLLSKGVSPESCAAVNLRLEDSFPFPGLDSLPWGIISVESADPEWFIRLQGYKPYDLFHMCTASVVCRSLFCLFEDLIRMESGVRNYSVGFQYSVFLWKSLGQKVGIGPLGREDSGSGQCQGQGQLLYLVMGTLINVFLWRDIVRIKPSSVGIQGIMPTFLCSSYLLDLHLYFFDIFLDWKDIFLSFLFYIGV